MASYDPNFLTQDDLCCSVCFEEYSHNSERVPKLLMCLHTLCVSCIKNIRNRIRTVVCPICRTQHKYVSLSDLCDNYVILTFLNNQQIEEDAVMAREESGISEDVFNQMTTDEAYASRMQQIYDEEVEETDEEEDCEDTIIISSDEN